MLKLDWGGWERDREPGWSRVEKVSRRKQEKNKATSRIDADKNSTRVLSAGCTLRFSDSNSPLFYFLNQEIKSVNKISIKKELK